MSKKVPQDVEINPETGEVLEDEPVPKGDYLRLFFAGMERILATEMRTTDIRVLLAVWLRAPLNGFAWDVAPTEIAEKLGMQRSHVHRALRRLEEAGLIERPVRGKVAFVKPVAWRGTWSER